MIFMAHRKHAGFWQIREHLCSRYWWKGIEEEVTKAIQECGVCFEGNNISEVD